jgi:hypothetical protein
MSWDVYMLVDLDRAAFDTDQSGIAEIFFGNFETKQLAQWWAINGKNVWLDSPNNTILIKTPLIVGVRIVEVP